MRTPVWEGYNCFGLGGELEGGELAGNSVISTIFRTGSAVAIAVETCHWGF